MLDVVLVCMGSKVRVKTEAVVFAEVCDETVEDEKEGEDEFDRVRLVEPCGDPPVKQRLSERPPAICRKSLWASRQMCLADILKSFGFVVGVDGDGVSNAKPLFHLILNL